MVCGFVRNWFVVLMALLATMSASSIAFAQDDGDDDEITTGGVEINAEGVLSKRAILDPTGALNRQRWEAAKASLNQDLKQPSNLRCVSLNRLEAEIAKLTQAGKPIPNDMKYLAGLTRITHVFYYPETNDIVIAGPAEGYFVTTSNYVVGIETGRSVLQLQDMVVALRAFSPKNQNVKVLSCSIDPTPEGIVNLKKAESLVKQNNWSPADPRIIPLFKEALGMQQITINGVSPKTNFARVMVEADYRMKLIGIGLERPAVKMTTFADKVTPTMMSRNSLMRWFFQPEYDCVTISQSGDAIQFTGSGVKLVGEDERVNQSGDRKNTGGANPASKAYTTSFTKVYDQLAAVDPVWNELRNVMDLSIAAAFIQKYDLYGKANWSMDLFGDESKFRTEISHSPTYVAPVANALVRGSTLMTPIAGGVAVQPRVALNTDRMKQDKDGTIAATKSGQNEKLLNLREGQWWWD